MSSYITIFIPSFRGGGAERAMILFANELALRGYKVDLLVLTREGPLADLVKGPVSIICLETERAIKSIPKVIAYLNQHKPSALYSTIIHVNLVSIIARFFSRAKTRVIIRESNTPVAAFSHTRSGRLSLAVLPFLYPMADAIIAVSDGVKDALVQMSGRMDKKIKIVPTPVLSSDMFSMADAPLPAFIKSPYIVAAGRLHFQKDFETLIRAFKLVNHKHENLSLVVLGEGDERKALELLISDLGLAGKVQLPGFIKNPFPIFKNAAAFVLSSKFEGMPNVLVQALALNVPCVSTDCESGPREVSEDGRYCSLVLVGDATSMAEAIVKAISSGPVPGAADVMKKKFSVSTSADSYLDLIS